jgi:membrane protease YdiL (CAAX protease family)
MPALRILFLYLLAVFAGAALVAPWLWHAVQSLASSHPALAGIASQPFHRYVNRCLLTLALLGLWPLVRAFRIQSPAETGWNPPWPRPLLHGFTLGFLALGLVTVLALIAGGRVWEAPTDVLRWIRRLFSAAATAAVVATLEELLFRGVVFGVLRRSLRFATVAVITSALYSWVHFFERPPRPDTIDALTGLVTLGQMLRGFTDPHALIPGWLSLVTAGWMLALARERTGGIAFSIGLHAGWIFWLKAYGFATREAPDATAAIWGTGRLFDGWLAFALLALQAFIVHRWLQPPTPARPT